MRTSPSSSRAALRARARAPITPSMLGLMDSSKRWPSSVSALLRVVRWNRRTPKCCSNWRMVLLTACGVVPCASATLLKLPSSAARIKVEMARSSSTAGGLALDLADMPVQAVGETLAIRLAEGGRAAGIDAAAAQLIHESAHGQHLRDVVVGVELAARIERVAALLQHIGCQRDVAGDDQVARRQQAYDFPVG